MIRFSLRQMTYFVATAEAGSTLRAAESLHVSQPAVSVAIGQLEEMFGHKLFVRRHARGLQLTPFGLRKLPEARQLLAHANAIAGADEGGGLSGELEIGVFSTLAAAYLPGLLRAFALAHPNVRVRMREDYLDQIYRDLEGGIIELGLLYDLLPGGDIVRTPLAEFVPYALLPEAHPLAKNERVSLADLADQPFVLIDLPHSRDYFLSLFRAHDLMPGQILRCASLETLRGMVAHGFGASILITRPCGDHSHDGQALACRPLAERVPAQRAIVARSGRAPATPLAQAFIAVTTAYFADRAGTGA